MLRSVHETVLYATDVAATARFFRDVLGLRAIGTSDGSSAVFRIPEGDAVLLVFHPDHAAAPNRGVPTHGTRGVGGHVAFRVDAGSLDDWRTRFASAGVAIEMDRMWDRGGRSVYVRDPAGNSIELVDGEIWMR